jgi:hypothetical protein
MNLSMLCPPLPECDRVVALRIHCFEPEAEVAAPPKDFRVTVIDSPQR